MVILANLAYSPTLKNPVEKMTYTGFIERVEKGEIASVEIQGQNIFGDGNIGEYFRQFIGYGVIALSLVIHAWRTKRQAEHNREALHTAAEGEAK